MSSTECNNVFLSDFLSHTGKLSFGFLIKLILHERVWFCVQQAQLSRQSSEAISAKRAQLVCVCMLVVSAQTCRVLARDYILCSFHDYGH